VVHSPIDANLWDDSVRVLAIDGNLYRYPPAFQRLTALGEIDDDTVLIGNSISAVPDSIHQIWAFDRTTRQITQFESACVDDDYLFAGELIDEPWTIVVSDDQAVLCHHSTGERSEPLPPDYLWVIDHFGIGPEPILSVSPDRRYVAFLGQIGLEPQAESSRNLELFSYDTVSRQIITLGRFNAQSSLQFDAWAGNQVTLHTGETCSVCGHSVYIADVSMPDSIEDAFGYLNIRGPAYFGDPPRYVFGIGNPSAIATCGHSVYDLATRTMTETQLGGCRPDFGSIDGVAYYRNVPERGSLGPTSDCCDIIPAEVPTVPVLRYDARTGESEEIYVGEVEQVVWVSSDERYAILLEDTNGIIDNVPYSRFPVEPQYGFTYLKLVDLVAGHGLTAVVNAAEWTQFTIIPVNDREFIMIDCSSEMCGGPVTVRATYLTVDDDGQLHEERLLHDFVIGATPDLSGILYWTHPYPPNLPLPEQTETLTGVGVYDIETGETYQLINPLDPALYRIDVQRRQDGRLHVQVSPRFDADLNSEAIFSHGQFSVYFETGEAPVVRIQHSFPAVGDYACLLYTGMVAANLRVLPGGDQERFGATIRGQTLLADGQAISPNDNLTWWRLADGGWVRSDFTMESSACAAVPTVDPTLNEGRIPFLQGAAVTCTVTTLAGVNLRSGAGVEFEAIGSAAENTPLLADGYQRSTSDLTLWWRLTTGEWVRDDFVQEDEGCAEVPEISATDPLQIAATPIGGPVCALTTTGGVNLRSGPGANYDHMGSAAEGTPLIGVGQAMSTSDFILWWQLDDGTWIRSDYTDEAPNCASLPTITPPEPPSTG
jgi:uncharacterized protein YraI